MKKPSKITILKLLIAAALFSAPSLKAQYVEYVTFNTSSLATDDSSNAPFYLDFQLNHGSDPASSTVTISNISITGGAAGDPSTILATAGASGSLQSTITLTADTTNAFVDLNQAFTPGSTVSFQVNLPLQGQGATPTAFLATILDSSANGTLTTTAPDGVSLNVVDIASSYTLGSLGAYSSPANGITTTAIPEPSTWVALAIGGLLIGGIAVRRKMLAQIA